MILERTTKGWYINVKHRDVRYLNTKQVKEIIKYLKEYKYKGVFFKENNLVIELNKEQITIVNYMNIKNRPYIRELNDKINKVIFREINKILNKYNCNLKKIYKLNINCVYYKNIFKAK